MAEIYVTVLLARHFPNGSEISNSNSTSVRLGTEIKRRQVQGVPLNVECGVSVPRNLHCR